MDILEILLEPFIKNLLGEEDKAIAEIIAFMTYNPSIGRALQEGGVKKFRRLALKLVNELHLVKGRLCFDKLHHRYVRKMIENFETANGSRLSYGLAQKPINVFLKVYVDWACRPTPVIRKRLIKHLHVPLDSILIKDIRQRYRKWHDENLRHHMDYVTQGDALSYIDKRQYDKWQIFFRNKYPPRPIIFDVVWAINRKFS